MARRRLAVVFAAIGAATLFAGSALASPSAELPPTWHVHDGQTSLGPQHKGIGFFPTILGETQAVYVQDPAECPDATDKAFLPSAGSAQSPMLRAGMCFTSSEVIHLRTLPVGTDGPAGWSSLTAATEPGWVTYYLVTSR